jgi:hypothetical protein
MVARAPLSSTVRPHFVTDKRYKPTEAPLAEQPSTSDSGSKWSLGPRIIFAIGWFVFCSGYLLWAALKSQSWWTTVIGSAVAIAVLIALCGVLRKWRWSQWIIYSFVLFWSVGWLYLLWGAARAGFFPLETVQLSVLSLVPGLSMLFASIWSADVVRRRFRLYVDAA